MFGDQPDCMSRIPRRTSIRVCPSEHAAPPGTSQISRSNRVHPSFGVGPAGGGERVEASSLIVYVVVTGPRYRGGAPTGAGKVEGDVWGAVPMEPHPAVSASAA